MSGLSDSPVSAPALAASGIVKRFGGLAAVDGVSLDLPPGRIHGLIGPNGAGKSTLFDCLAGEIAADAGRIEIGGARVERLGPEQRLRRGLGRTFQIPRPFPRLSVLENVMLGAQGQLGERILPNFLLPAAVARQERAAREKALDLLAFVGLERHAEAPARVLSGGERKLLELARALMAAPRLLLLDEPAAGVNPALLEIVLQRILDINKQGVAVLVIEHDMQAVAALCAHVHVMAAGRVLCEGTPKQVLNDARVVEAYLGGAAA